MSELLNLQIRAVWTDHNAPRGKRSQLAGFIDMPGRVIHVDPDTLTPEQLRMAALALFKMADKIESEE